MRVQVDTIRKAITSLKNRKANGPEGIYAEMLKNGTPKLFERITYIVNECLNGQPVPTEWKVAYISSIYKKGNKQECNNYRSISITSTMIYYMDILYGRILRDLIEDFRITKKKNKASVRVDHAPTMSSVSNKLEKRTAKNMETHITFVDLQKAYDTVPICKLWTVLQQSNINHIYIGTTRIV